MCLERAFSGYLAYFFEVGLRGDTKGPKRGKEGEGLSPVDIGDRASDSDGGIRLSVSVGSLTDSSGTTRVKGRPFTSTVSHPIMMPGRVFACPKAPIIL